MHACIEYTKKKKKIDIVVALSVYARKCSLTGSGLTNGMCVSL